MSRRYVVILGAMRTGSNLLERTLGSFAGIRTYGEAYNPAFVSGPMREEVLGWTVEARNADPMGFLMEMRADAAANGAMAAFRLFPGHDATILNHVLSDPECLPITLRRDPVQSFVSLLISRVTDQWMLRDPSRRLPARVRFEPGEFDAYCRALNDHHVRVDRKLQGRAVLRLTFDDLSEPSLAGRLAAFTGLMAPAEVTPGLVRQNPEPLRAKVENYAEMCAHLGRVEMPLRPEAIPGPDGFLCPHHTPVALAPLPGPGLIGAQVLLARIDRGAGSTPMPGRQEAVQMALAGDLLPAGPRDRRPAAAILSDPLDRLLWIAEREITSWRSLALIQLQTDVPALADATSLADLPADQVAETVVSLTRIVEMAASGQGHLPMRAAWRPQTDWFASLGLPAGDATLFRAGAIRSLARWLADEGLAASIPPGHVRSAVQHEAPVIARPELAGADLARVHRLFAPDYALLETLGADDKTR